MTTGRREKIEEQDKKSVRAIHCFLYFCSVFYSSFYFTSSFLSSFFGPKASIDKTSTFLEGKETGKEDFLPNLLFLRPPLKNRLLSRVVMMDLWRERERNCPFTYGKRLPTFRTNLWETSNVAWGSGFHLNWQQKWMVLEFWIREKYC